jgi:hypothetical protein
MMKLLSLRLSQLITPCIGAVLLLSATDGASCRAADMMPNSFQRKSIKAAKEVPLGIWITSIGKLNFPDNSYRATFWISGILPQGEEKLLTRLDFVNADTHTFLNSAITQETRGPVTYQKVAGTFRNEWKLKNYPFDHHTLRLCIDSCETLDQLSLTGNDKDSGYDPEINSTANGNPDGVNGWKVTGFRLLSSVKNYVESPDTKTASNLTCSTITAEIDIRRCSYAIFWKMTAAAFAAMILVIITYFLPIQGPENMSPYFATFVGAVFAIVINLKSANTELGSSSDITLIDKIHLEALAYVLFAAFVTTVARIRIAAGVPAATLNRQRALIAVGSILLMTILISSQVYHAIANG